MFLVGNFKLLITLYLSSLLITWAKLKTVKTTFSYFCVSCRVFGQRLLSWLRLWPQSPQCPQARWWSPTATRLSTCWGLIGFHFKDNQSVIIYPSPSEVRGLGMKNWKKEIVCHNACVWQWGSNYCGLSVCVYVTYLLPGGCTILPEIFRGSCGHIG